MAALFGRGRNAGSDRKTGSLLEQVTEGSPVTDGWRFSLKGSPRFYDDVLRIIESDAGAQVYFGEALTYERGAAVALWRVRGTSLSLPPPLFYWGGGGEGLEPLPGTFFLYILPALQYPPPDLPPHTPPAVEALL